MKRRTLQDRLVALAEQYPVVFLTGPRQSGKTTLTRMAFPEYEYVSLEDLQNREEALEDPRGFLRRREGAEGVILDEVQRTPDLFSYLQGIADEGRSGPYILTGSQQFLLDERISQTLAGRAAILELLPFSLAELAGRAARAPEELRAPSRSSPVLEGTLDEHLFTGSFPRIHDRGLDPIPWLDGYLRTYVERDVRTLTNIGDLDAFTRFLGLCAGRAGSLLNLSALGADAGVTHVTAKRWISILRAGYVIDLLRPHSENFGKRLVRAPKLYFTDTGLLCRLLGVRSPGDLRLHPLRGAIFENLIVSELRKVFLHRGERPPIWFWRDSRGREVDVLVDLGTRRIPFEAKAGETVPSDAFKGLDDYGALSGKPGGVLVHGGDGASYERRGHLVRSWREIS